MNKNFLGVLGGHSLFPSCVFEPPGCHFTPWAHGQIERRPPTLSKQEKKNFLPVKLLKRQGRLYLFWELALLEGCGAKILCV